MSATVLFVGHGAERTGPPIGLLHLLRWLRATTDLEMAVLLLDGGPLLEEYRAVAPVWVLDEWSLPTVPAATAAVARRLRCHRLADRIRSRALRRRLRGVPTPAVVYVNTAWSIRALHYLDIGEAPVITVVHELSVGLEFHLQAPERQLLLDRSQRLIAVSEAVRDDLVSTHQVAPERVAVHYELIAVEGAGPGPAGRAGDGATRRRAELGIAPEALVVGASGLLHWRKAPDLFLLLAQTLLSSRPGRDVHFVWVGGEGVASATRQILHGVDRSPLRDRVHFVPHQDRPLDWFQTFDVMVLPAREDAFPLVCLEAASAGVPIVCFDNGGMPELVREAQAGAVVRFPDVEEMVRQTARLLDDPDLRRAEGRRLQRHVRDHHDVGVIGPRLLAEIERAERSR